MDVSLFDFDLPEESIALRPIYPRDHARLMVIHADGRLEHRLVRDLPDYVGQEDAIVVNDTRVFPARLRGKRIRENGAAAVELLLHRQIAGDRFLALARPAKKLNPQDVLVFGDLKGRLIGRQEGQVEIQFEMSGDALRAAIAEQGEIPLPPYIAGKRPVDARDSQEYQTMFAQEVGSVAAPTAGLHFTPELIAALQAKGASHERLTLHVGLGTFLPVTANDTAQHIMHSEYARLDEDTANRLNLTRQKDGRILAVGTTTLRTLESAALDKKGIAPFDGETGIFITPGYEFRIVDRLMTNFHLPRSTLFMLVCAFSGIDVMKRAYAEAVRLGYRFYSYGDACLLIRPR